MIESKKNQWIKGVMDHDMTGTQLKQKFFFR